MSQQHIEEIENKIFGELPFKAKAKDIKLIIEYAKEQAERAQELQAENETLPSANQDLLHEVRVLRNKVDQSKEYEDFVFHHNDDVDVEMRKLHEQNKRYRERADQLINYIEMTDDETDRQVHKIHVILDGLLEDAE